MKTVMLAALLAAGSAHATYVSPPTSNTAPPVITNGGAGGSVTNSVTNSVKNSVTNTVTNVNPPHVEQRQQQKQRQRQRQTQAIKDSGNSTNTNTSQSNNTNNVTVQAGWKRSTSSAYAPSIPPTTVCAGSTQGAAFGVSFGTSWTDANCMLLEQVRAVAVVLHDDVTASEMMCAVAAYREARIRTGNPCKQAPNTVTNLKQEQYTDPINCA